jgi:hypothetical protein
LSQSTGSLQARANGLLEHGLVTLYSRRGDALSLFEISDPASCETNSHAERPF